MRFLKTSFVSINELGDYSDFIIQPEYPAKWKWLRNIQMWLINEKIKWNIVRNQISEKFKKEQFEDY